MKHCLFPLIIVLASTFSFSQTTWQTNKAKVGTDGCLTYEADANLNRIPNFSHAGYKGGGVEIPFVEAKKTISPISGDNTAHIQAAIDFVEALPLDGNGFRGAVYLTSGQYEVNGQLFINQSGVVLRGAGDGRGDNAATVIYGTGNTPAQRDLIIMGGGTNTMWRGEVANTKQNITTDFVQVGSYSFEVSDVSSFTVGDNIIINHPCSANWLAAIDNGGTGSDPSWEVDDYPIIYNRFITAISGNEITIDAPVYNHLERSLSQSYIYKYDRAGIVSNLGFEEIKVEIESLGGEDENHIWNAVQITQAENAWVRNATISGFGLSGVRTETVNHISVVNVRSVDPVAIVTGGRMYNFNSYVCSNNILFDNCYARNGRHHFVSNGVGSVSGFVVLNSISENPFAASEGHRHWTTGMLFDNLQDIGTYPSAGEYVMAFYNRGDYGSGHGWSAAHSVFWNCEVNRPGKDATIVVEQPPTAQNYAIGCKGRVGVTGPFNQPTGYVEGSNEDAELTPKSLYEAQLLCRTDAVIADFQVSKASLGIGENVVFTSNCQGEITNYSWDFGTDATPLTISGIGPHQVTYSTGGLKTVTLTVSNNSSQHSEIKYDYVEVSDEVLFAVEDEEFLLKDETVITSVLDNDSYSYLPENNAFMFDGVDDKIVYNTTTLMDEYPFTMAAWVKTTSNAGQVIMYNGNGFSGVTGNSLSIRSGKPTLEAWVYSGSSTKENITSLTNINDGVWHHVAGVFTSATERLLYVDGVLVGTDNAPLNNVETQELNRFSVGNREDSSPGDWFEGSIDEVRVYTETFTKSEINNLMMGWDCTKKDKLLYWSFDEQLTTQVSDKFNYFDGEVTGGSSTASDINLSNLSIEIISEPKNGTASFSGNFEITYQPQEGYIGLDSLTYLLKIGECDSSYTSIIYHIDEITGVSTHAKNEFSVYPNPSNGIVFLSDKLLEQSTKITLVNSRGFVLGDLSLEKKIDLSDLANGIYILKLENKSGEIINKKVVLAY